MTPMNIAMTTLLNGIYLGALLAAAMMLLLKLFPRLNPTTRFTVLWITLFAVVVLLAAPLTPRRSSRAPRIESLVVVSPSPVVIPASTAAQVYRPGRRAQDAHVEAVAAQRSTSTSEQHLETLSQNASTNFLARRIAIRAFSDSHSLGKVSSCAGNGMDDVLVGAACPVRRGILGFAKAEIKRNAGVARLATALQSFVRDPRRPPSAAIARFEPCQRAHVAWLPPPDDCDSVHAVRDAFTLRTAADCPARNRPLASPRRLEQPGSKID